MTLAKDIETLDSPSKAAHKADGHAACNRDSAVAGWRLPSEAKATAGLPSSEFCRSTKFEIMKERLEHKENMHPSIGATDTAAVDGQSLASDKTNASTTQGTAHHSYLGVPVASADKDLLEEASVSDREVYQTGLTPLDPRATDIRSTRSSVDATLKALGVDVSKPIPIAASVPPPLLMQISNPGRLMTQPMIETPCPQSGSLCSRSTFSSINNMFTPSTASCRSNPNPFSAGDGTFTFRTGFSIPNQGTSSSDMSVSRVSLRVPVVRPAPAANTAPVFPFKSPMVATARSQKRRPLITLSENEVSKKIRPDTLPVPSVTSKPLVNRRPILYSKKPCSCPKSQCIRLYCECFQEGVLCSQSCSCTRCLNNGPSVERTRAIRKILKRRPAAFGSRLKKTGDDGCACKKTNCLKKYCVCLARGVRCHELCTCRECKNLPSPGAPSTGLMRYTQEDDETNIEALSPAMLRETVAAALLHLERTPSVALNEPSPSDYYPTPEGRVEAV